MLDHVSISVPADRFEEVTNWYLAALAPLGYSKWKDFPGQAVGLGADKYKVHFWIGATKGPTGPTHIGFGCNDRAIVDKFHEEGMKAGGKCNGAPGLRHMYHPKYYAAFVLDPVGYVFSCTVNHLSAHIKQE